MKKMKKFLALACAGVMCVSIIGCSKKGTTDKSKDNDKVQTTQTTTDKVQTAPTETAKESDKETIDLSYPIKDSKGVSVYSLGLGLPAQHTSYEDVPFWKGLEEVTGEDIDITGPIAGADWKQTWNLMLTEKELPDIVMKYTNASEVEQLIEDGIIYDLTEYLPIYAPDYWELMHRPEYAAELKGITTKSGKISFFASMRENLFGISFTGPVVREDWLKECGLDEPVTIADWEEMLIAFKEKYNAEFGFTLTYYNYGCGMASGFNAYGGFDARYYVDDNGKIQFAQAQPEWLESMKTLHKWYEMGLIDPDVLTMDNDVMRSKVLNNEIGASVTAMSQITNWTMDAEKENTGAKWIGVSLPRVAPGAPTSIMHGSASLLQGFGAFITTSCPEEKLIEAIRFLNYGYTKEGYMYWNYGKEGDSYTLNADGTVSFTDKVTPDYSIENFSGTTGAGIAVQAANLVRAKNVKVAGDAVDKWIENTTYPSHCVPSLSYESDTKIKLDDLSTVISTKTNEVSLKYLTGEESLDNYQSFIKELEALGLNEVLEIMQTAYDEQYK